MVPQALIEHMFGQNEPHSCLECSIHCWFTR